MNIFNLFHINVLTVVVLLILLFGILDGHQKGFLRITFSLVSWIFAIVLVVTINPYVTSIIEEKTMLDESITESVEQYIRENGLGVLSSEGEKDKVAILEDSGLIFPTSVLDLVTEGAYKTVEDIVEKNEVYTKVASGVAHFVIKGISFIVTWCIVWLILRIINRSLRLVDRVPIIGGVNRTLGIGAGAIKALLIIWLMFYLISLCCATEFGLICMKQIRESTFLKFLYENNLIVIFLCSR